MSNGTRRLAAMINPSGDAFPDDDSTKLIELQAAGRCPGAARHVLLRWTNGQNGHVSYTQLIHLIGGQGNYAFYTPQVQPHSEASRQFSTFYPLGYYTRAQRDQIIALAQSIPFDRNSHVNNCCVWMRDLLRAMVAYGLLRKDIFDRVVAATPLERLVPRSDGTA
uniref:CAAX prenyl protease (EC) n=1 Tax=Ganoderma boninense TaxID=34458 RepID=A0A5K1K4E2_9APHY|nr:CAAX prenyl protease (EC [Ganoderma boninense]